MIEQYRLKGLYETISEDLTIVKFDNETDESYRCRLVYSALGKWILSMFSDRDFEEDDCGRVSKSHVTISAVNLLRSYKKIDAGLNGYFSDDKKLVNLIENVYLELGYVKSGSYSFKEQARYARLAIANKTLDIDADSKIKKTRGLGTWRKQTESDLRLDDFLLVKESAESYAKKLIAQLRYSEFSSTLGKNEIYNIEKNRWESYSERLAAKYSFSIIKVDDGLDYKALKTVEGAIYAASLPAIYTKKATKGDFVRDVWRIILGVCSVNGRKAKCFLKDNGDGSMSIRFGGFVLPYLEDALIRCMCWPAGDCLSHTEFLTDSGMKQAVVELLMRLSVEICEEGMGNGE